MSEPRVVLVSVPGLLADDLLPLSDSPALRAISAMIENGALGLVRQSPGTNVTQHLWTMATGQPAGVHGVPGPFAAMPERQGIHPIGRFSSQRPPLWELSAMQGLKSCCIGWPGTRDSSARDLFVVTDDIHSPLGTSRMAWPLLPGTATERELELLDLRVHPCEIPPQDIDFFIEGSTAPPLRGGVARAIGAAATVQAVLLHVLAARPCRLIAVHFDWLDRIRRLAGRSGSVAPRMIARGYRFLDLLIDRLRRELTQRDVLILAGPAAHHGGEHIAQGVLILEGPGIAADALLGQVNLTDVAPTALHAAGASISRELPGRVLTGAWKAALPPRMCDPGSPADAPVDDWALSEVRRLGLRAPRPLESFRRQIEQLLAERQ